MRGHNQVVLKPNLYVSKHRNWACRQRGNTCGIRCSLPLLCSEEALQYLSASVAPVTAVRLIRDHSAARGSRTFGFVEFYSIADATNALNALQVLDPCFAFPSCAFSFPLSFGQVSRPISPSSCAFSRPISFVELSRPASPFLMSLLPPPSFFCGTSETHL